MTCKSLKTGLGSDFLISILKNLSFFCLTSPIIVTDLKMYVCLEKNNFVKCWGYLCFLNWIGVLTLSLLLKLHPRKLEPWFVLWSLFLLNFLFKVTLSILGGLLKSPFPIQTFFPIQFHSQFYGTTLSVALQDN